MWPTQLSKTIFVLTGIFASWRSQLPLRGCFKLTEALVKLFRNHNLTILRTVLWPIFGPQNCCFHFSQRRRENIQFFHFIKFFCLCPCFLPDKWSAVDGLSSFRRAASIAWLKEFWKLGTGIRSELSLSPSLSAGTGSARVFSSERGKDVQKAV